MRAIASALAALLVVLACGKTSPAPAPPPTSPAPEPQPQPEPSGNPTTAEPTPSPSPGPSPTPSPTPTPTPTPTPSPSPPPDRGATIERLDSDPECDALVPSDVPAPVTLRVDGSGNNCLWGLSDGTGHVAVWTGVNGSGTHFQVFSKDGTKQQDLRVGGSLVALPEGWQGATSTPTPGKPGVSLSVLTFFGDGTPRRSETATPDRFTTNGWLLTDDPLGGSLLVQTGTTSSGACAGEARRFGSDGAPRPPATFDACNSMGHGVSNAGETLILQADHPEATLRWFTADGAAVGGPSDDGPTSVPFASGGYPGQRPLLDGSLVMHSGSTWTRVYPHLAAHGEAPPAWLAARGSQSYRFTRGNKGYAFFPSPYAQSPDCTQQVELVAPSGRRCARVTFHRDGLACTTGFIDQGWDGTVVQQDAAGACSWRSWPGFFGG